jgi:hypothetical protein
MTVHDFPPPPDGRLGWEDPSLYLLPRSDRAEKTHFVWILGSLRLYVGVEDAS